MLFALQYENTVNFAAYRADRVIMSDSRSMDDWELKLKGLNLRSTWDALIADVSGLESADGKSLDEMILQNENIKKLEGKIAILEKKARNERQPRRKWDLAQEIKQLKEQLKGAQ